MSYEEQQAYLIRKLRDFTNPDTNKVTYYYEKVSTARPASPASRGVSPTYPSGHTAEVAARSASPAADEHGGISDLPIRPHY